MAGFLGFLAGCLVCCGYFVGWVSGFGFWVVGFGWFRVGVLGLVLGVCCFRVVLIRIWGVLLWRVVGFVRLVWVCDGLLCYFDFGGWWVYV